jgi:hypothetical protein
MCTGLTITMSLYDEGARCKVLGSGFTLKTPIHSIAVSLHLIPCTLYHFAYPKVRKSKKCEGVYDD